MHRARPMHAYAPTKTVKLCLLPDCVSGRNCGQSARLDPVGSQFPRRFHGFHGNLRPCPNCFNSLFLQFHGNPWTFPDAFLKTQKLTQLQGAIFKTHAD